MIKHWFAVIVIGCGMACGRPTLPQPQSPTADIDCLVTDIWSKLPILGAVCAINNQSVITNADGYGLLLKFPFGAYDMTITKDGYEPGTYHFEVMGNYRLRVALTPVKPNTGEPLVPLHADDAGFRRPDGSVYHGAGITDFALYGKFLDSVDIGPVLTDRVRLGFKSVRVFGMWDSGYRLYPQEHTDFYTRLPAFSSELASYGLRLEFVVFADAQIIMPDEEAERTHILAVVQAFAGAWNVFIEVGNECFKNIPGGDMQCQRLGQLVLPNGGLVSFGSVEMGPFPPIAQGNYGTHHTERSWDWPRKAKDIYDVWSVTHVPFIADEPIGAAEVEVPGRRTANAADYRQYAANAALYGGFTFHCDLCITSDVLIGLQREIALAAIQGFNFVPSEAPWWPYQRGGEDDGPGVGNIPVLHRDNLELRTYCKGNGTHAWCVQTRTTRETAIARDDWHIVAQPWRGFVELER